MRKRIIPLNTGEFLLMRKKTLLLDIIQKKSCWPNARKFQTHSDRGI